MNFLFLRQFDQIYREFQIKSVINSTKKRE